MKKLPDDEEYFNVEILSKFVEGETFISFH